MAFFVNRIVNGNTNKYDILLIPLTDCGVGF
jgi:hypothetical protein